MSDIVQNVAMKAVIARQGKLLLLRESAEHDTNTNAGRYQFPGGRIEPGEPFLDGLRREVMEETGLQVVVGEPLYAGEWFPVIKGVPHHIVALFLVCEPESIDVVISEEHDGYVWADQARAKGLDIMKPDSLVVEAFFQKYAD